MYRSDRPDGSVHTARLLEQFRPSWDFWPIGGQRIAFALGQQLVELVFEWSFRGFRRVVLEQLVPLAVTYRNGGRTWLGPWSK